MAKDIKIGEELIGEKQPVFFIAEIGINHNGCLKNALKLIKTAKDSGCNAVKFQKRNPLECIPDSQINIKRETPWGKLSYIDYRKKIEFGIEQYLEIDNYCKKLNILWFASCWDVSSVEFIENFNTPCIKVPSAQLTNYKLLKNLKQTNKPIILSTGMSTMEQIQKAASIFEKSKLLICHSTSSYPCASNDVNLKMIKTLQKAFDCIIGYSGHELTEIPTIGAVALGAKFVERHITLDKRMWGSDHKISLEPEELRSLMKNIRELELSLGDGLKKVYKSEFASLKRLRNINSLDQHIEPKSFTNN